MSYRAAGLSLRLRLALIERHLRKEITAREALEIRCGILRMKEDDIARQLAALRAELETREETGK